VSPIRDFVTGGYKARHTFDALWTREAAEEEDASLIPSTYRVGQ
jgi:hypothetical protein